MTEVHSVEQAELYLSGLFETNWVRLPRSFVQALGPQDGVVLAELVAIYREPSVREYRAENDGWFFVTVERLQHDLGMSEDRQRRACQALAKAGLLRVGRRGVPPRRHILLDLVAIANLAAAPKPANPPALKPANPPALKPANPPASSLQGERKHSGDITGLDPPIGGRAGESTNRKGSADGPSDFTDLAADYISAVRRHLGPTHPNIRRANRNQWAANIRRLVTKGGHDAEEVEQVCRWYMANLAAPYVPIAHSGTTFFKKYDAIRERWSRSAIATTRPGPQASELAIQLWELGWPGINRSTLASAIQVCLDRLHTWYTVAAEVVRASEHNALRVYWEHVKADLGPATTYAHTWFRQVHRRVVRYENWDGDLQPYLWSPAQMSFGQRLAAISQEVTGTKKCHEQLELMIQEHYED